MAANGAAKHGDMTDDEAKRIAAALEKPEFRKLFEDYLKEISDPKNKQEYETYISQLEADAFASPGGAQMPAGKKLMKPIPWMCVKAKTSKGEKLFINLCHSPLVQEPSSSAAAKDKAKGSNWSIPYVMGTKRECKDKGGETCCVFDFTVNSTTKAVSNSSAGMKNMVIDTALEAVGKFGVQVNLKQPYTILNAKFKGGEPLPYMVKSGESLTAAPVDDRKPASSASRTAEGKIARTDVSSSGPPTTVTAPKLLLPPTSDQDTSSPSKEKTPVYKIIERGELTLQDFALERELALPKRPQELSLRIELPLLDSISSVDVDLSQRHLHLFAPSFYSLDVTLPYKVEDEKGKAKFNKSNRLLTIDVPVAPLSREEIDEYRLKHAAVRSASPSGVTAPEQPEPPVEQLTGINAKEGTNHLTVSTSLSSSSLHSLGVSPTTENKTAGNGRSAIGSVGVRPAFMFQQQLDRMVICVRVPQIQKDTVKIEYLRDQVNIRFSAPPSQDGGAQSPLLAYELLLPLAGTIDPDRCSYDANEENLIIQLMKATPTMWTTLARLPLATSLSPRPSPSSSPLSSASLSPSNLSRSPSPSDGSSIVSSSSSASLESPSAQGKNSKKNKKKREKEKKKKHAQSPVPTTTGQQTGGTTPRGQDTVTEAAIPSPKKRVSWSKDLESTHVFDLPKSKSQQKKENRLRKNSTSPTPSPLASPLPSPTNAAELLAPLDSPLSFAPISDEAEATSSSGDTFSSAGMRTIDTASVADETVFSQKPSVASATSGPQSNAELSLSAIPLSLPPFLAQHSMPASFSGMQKPASSLFDSSHPASRVKLTTGRRILEID